MKKEEVIFNWSGGKDSAMALYEVLEQNTFSVYSLVTTVNKDYHRISMHGIRDEILQLQVENMGIPLTRILLSSKSSNEEYNQGMYEAMSHFIKRGIKKAVFGDIFLEDIRLYRENQLKKVNMTALFPLWLKSTEELSVKFIGLGFKAVVTCVDTQQLSGEFCGMEYNKDFLDKLPDKVDPCGENGEFHTLVYDGPIFKEPLNIRKGEKVLRDNQFYYCDVLPG